MSCRTKMQMQYMKLHTDEKEIFLQRCMMGECHTIRKNILNKKILEYMVMYR
jgi:hypothetical protein